MRVWQRSAVALAIVIASLGATTGTGWAEEDNATVRRARAQMEAARAEAAAATQAYVDAVALQARTETRIATLEARIPVLEARINDLRDLLARRSADLYASGDVVGIVAVQTAIDTNDLTMGARASHLAEAAQKDVDAHADEFESTKASLESDKAELEVAREEQRKASENAAKHSEEMTAALERANSVLREAEQEQSLQRYFAAVEAQHQAQFAAALAALAAGAPPVDDPDTQRPPADPAFAGEIPVFEMPCPVTGTVTFVDDWGQPRSGWRVHQGTDMFAPIGTPNIAVGDGVARMRTGGLGGNALWLVTDDGHAYYYAHFDAFEGVFGPDGTRRVVRGEVLGYTGNTGNASGGPYHTHFEIHPRNVGPTNPFPLLRDMCAVPSAPPPPPTSVPPTTVAPLPAP